MATSIRSRLRTTAGRAACVLPLRIARADLDRLRSVIARRHDHPQLDDLPGSEQKPSMGAAAVVSPLPITALRWGTGVPERYCCRYYDLRREQFGRGQYLHLWRGQHMDYTIPPSGWNSDGSMSARDEERNCRLEPVQPITPLSSMINSYSTSADPRQSESRGSQRASAGQL